MWIILAVFAVLVVAVAIYDVTQKKHAILRNFPIIGHFRYMLEAVGPELRQYIVTNNDEERPFSRDQRRWIYSSAKKENNYFGFGTDNDLEQSPNYLIVKHAAFPLPELHAGEPGYDPGYRVPCAKVLGGKRNRKKAFRANSVINSSAMSYGSLSGAAVEAINRGAKIAGCMQNTGEGGVSPHHRHGGDLVWQIGTGYFGCRDEKGRFSMERFLETVASAQIRMIEIKLSQGAKPGLGGVLPGAKVTSEIAKIRGIPIGETCISPAAHTAFSSADELLDFAEKLAEASGLPVGIKSAVGQEKFWHELAKLMGRGDRGVDFITIDGGEGGTGAAPLVFSDHVALPFKIGMSRIYRIFAEAGIAEDVVFIGSGKLGFPHASLLAFALGCDMVNVAREAMLSIGCIQAQECHTGHCPTGVATQNRWLVRGLDPTDKAARFANYVTALRKELLQLARACGVPHPALVTLDELDILDDRLHARPASAVFEYQPGWGRPSAADMEAIRAIMAGKPAPALPSGEGLVIAPA
ncbi:FMN-binding glutamate synthase family protein [Polyangium jinanense]|uniref:FMN-binding glutamate synthase family protein n=1 Tax=Polyangium jinanense TaxID=2829994 RepID=A0A9X3X047_9BACT|nr:FMN-binding glutamate synthase family protein [Polyangium jinanense]MDC3954988.1 FMN-binding glutamate synthase family protein [Polyangium jinanense]MDC3981242.1 FMN-binding glutamate synthase family protein [Polyangium jinanense]